MEQETKRTIVCNCCGQEKPVEAFKITRLGNYYKTCTECVGKAIREGQKKGKEKREADIANAKLSKFTARELMEELKRRGYKGRLTCVVTKVVDFETL